MPFHNLGFASGKIKAQGGEVAYSKGHRTSGIEKGQESNTPITTSRARPSGTTTTPLTTVPVNMFTAEADLASLILKMGLLSSSPEQLRKLEFLRSGTEE